MDAELLFELSCDMVGNTIYCSIETNVENAEFAFYVNIDGERKATFWYTRCHRLNTIAEIKLSTHMR